MGVQKCIVYIMMIKNALEVEEFVTTASHCKLGETVCCMFLIRILKVMVDNELWFD